MLKGIEELGVVKSGWLNFGDSWLGLLNVKLVQDTPTTLKPDPWCDLYDVISLGFTKWIVLNSRKENSVLFVFVFDTKITVLLNDLDSRKGKNYWIKEGVGTTKEVSRRFGVSTVGPDTTCFLFR